MTSPSSSDYSTLVAAPDRTEMDRALDASRKPADFLAFLGLKPGMRVGEMLAGGGYTTELLARAVGPQGAVYAGNPAAILKLFAAQPWADRLARPVNKNVVRTDRELEDPFPPEVKDLDMVVFYGHYHDVSGLLSVDRAKMNRGAFAALKSGGHYAIVDSSARPGTGGDDAAKLHRVEEEWVKREIESAGFKLERSGDFLRNPNDARDWDSNPFAAGDKRGTSDRFALIFVKP